MYAVDQKTGILSDTITFVVTIRLRATGLNIVPGTELSDRTYKVSDPAILLVVPEYTIFPANSNTDCFHQLGAGAPAFVTLVPDADPLADPKIQILTTSAADTGIYSIDLIYTDLFSGLTHTDTFILTVSCVRTITQPNLVAPVTYWITDPTIPISLPAYDISPADCPYELLVEFATLVDDSALPGAIIFDGTNTVNVLENTHANTGVYDVKVTVKDPKSLLTNSDLTF